jgi:hypothetical protein
VIHQQQISAQCLNNIITQNYFRALLKPSDIDVLLDSISSFRHFIFFIFKKKTFGLFTRNLHSHLKDGKSTTSLCICKNSISRSPQFLFDSPSLSLSQCFQKNAIKSNPARIITRNCPVCQNG